MLLLLPSLVPGTGIGVVGVDALVGSDNNAKAGAGTSTVKATHQLNVNINLSEKISDNGNCTQTYLTYGHLGDFFRCFS